MMLSLLGQPSRGCRFPGCGGSSLSLMPVGRAAVRSFQMNPTSPCSSFSTTVLLSSSRNLPCSQESSRRPPSTLPFCIRCRVMNLSSSWSPPCWWASRACCAIVTLPSCIRSSVSAVSSALSRCSPHSPMVASFAGLSQSSGESPSMTVCISLPAATGTSRLLPGRHRRVVLPATGAAAHAPVGEPAASAAVLLQEDAPGVLRHFHLHAFFFFSPVFFRLVPPSTPGAAAPGALPPSLRDGFRKPSLYIYGTENGIGIGFRSYDPQFFVQNGW